MAKQFETWRSDPVSFIEGALINPETGKRFELYPAEIEFVRRAFTLTADGRLPFPETLFSAPKKSGKTALAGMLAVYVAVVIGGRFAEVYCLSNDYEQSVGRVFEAAKRIVEASPMLAGSAKITADRIEFTSTGSFIQACASDYSGFAGANPSLCIFDELWAYVSERAHRLWDEAVPSPTRKVSGRLTVSYAGFEGESELLEGLYKRAITGTPVAADLYECDGMLAYWTHTPPAPWQNAEWLSRMRVQSRPNAYLRHCENRWVSSESTFIEMEWWDNCVDPEAHPELADPRLSVWCGVDASVKRDSTAVVCCAFDPTAKKIRLVWHRVFQPSAADPLDFETTIEGTLLDLRRRFHVREVRFDPWQMQAVAQRLTAAGLPMLEFAQSVPNLTEASTNLYEAIKGRNLIAYPDDDIRLAISRCVAIETSRGWRIAKEKASHKIDCIVALAQAALGAVRQGQVTTEYAFMAVPRSVTRTGAVSGSAWGRHNDAADDAAADARRGSLVMRSRRSRWAGY
ncbi:MAG TPA: terminase TerL endonuclease subunit [Candidatus Binataceae bacterium]|nr:terminase TerL endonuclease subunit [Candidatus Binataceae bacterium]